ncbi:MAG: hypothetical protein RXO53_06860 [Caldisphaera sp.]
MSQNTSSWKWIAVVFIVLFVVAIAIAGAFYIKSTEPVIITTTTTSTTTMTVPITTTTTSTTTMTVPATVTAMSYVTTTETVTPSNYYSLLSIVNLENSTTLANDQTVNEPAGQNSSLSYYISYAGYVEVEVLSSTTSNTYVEVSGAYNGGSYSSGEISVGTGGTVLFPVLPGTVTITIGNTNVFSGATQTVTILYVY